MLDGGGWYLQVIWRIQERQSIEIKPLKCSEYSAINIQFLAALALAVCAVDIHQLLEYAQTFNGKYSFSLLCKDRIADSLV